MKAMSEKNRNVKWSDIPASKYPVYDVYGKEFDPGKVIEYIDSFEIKRS